ncbi:hypothetical protein REPUB_Repub12eG0006200 [Reevesia pubescens]
MRSLVQMNFVILSSIRRLAIKQLEGLRLLALIFIPLEPHHVPGIYFILLAFL